MKTSTRLIIRLQREILCAGLVLASVTVATAADRTWNGGGDQTSWSDPNNWGGTAPVASDRLFFDGAVGLSPNNNITANTVFSNITFNATAGAFTLGGNAINLAAGSSAVGGVTNLSANAQIINLTINNNGGPRVYNALSNDILVTANINSSTLVKEGPFNLILANSANDSSLGAVVDGGALILAGTVATAIGSTVTIHTNGTVIIAGPADQIHYNQRVNVEQGGTLDNRHLEEFGMLSSTGAVSGIVLCDTNSAQTLQCGGGSGHKGIFNGTLMDGTAPLNYELHRDGHIQVCNGSNSYSGTTTVDNNQSATPSRLIINGVHLNGGAYSINCNKGTLSAPAAYLGGTGLVSATAFTFATGAASGNYGAISPGGVLSANSDSATFSDTTGILTLSNSVANVGASNCVVLLNTNSTVTVQLNGTTAGTSYDQIILAGNTILTNNGANLNLALGYTPSPGDKFTIVKVHDTSSTNNIGVFTSLNGVAMNLSQGATFVEPSSGKNFQISYQAEGSTFDMGAGNGNDIMLQVVAPVGGQNLTWRGDGVNNYWDITNTADWWNGTSLTTFTNGDFVTFDDSGSNNVPVNILTAITPGSILVNATNNYEFDGGGPGGPGYFTNTVVLTKTNTDTLTITADNVNLGSTIVQSGKLQIGTNGTSGTLSGALTIQSNGVVIHNRSDDVTSGLAFTGTGGFVHTGSGAFILNVAAPFTGHAANIGGTFQLGDGTSTAGSIAGDINVGSTNLLRYYYSGGDVTIGNTISGTGTVLYDLAAGNRTYTIPTTTVNSNFAGTNIINSGIRLHASDGNAGYILGNGGVVNVTALGSQVWLDRSATAYNQAFILSGTGWTGDATPLGAMRIFGCTVSGPVTFMSDTRIGGSINGGTISGPIIGGSSQLEVLGNANSFILSLSNNANAWGNTLVTSGAIRALAPAAISTNAMTIDLNGELDVYGNTVFVNNLNDGPSGAGVVYNQSTATNGTIVIGADNSSVNFDGTFGDGSSRALNVTKVGSGVLTLTAVSTNTGTVSVKGGTLALSGSGSFGNAAVIASASGATYDVTGAGGTLTLNSGQTLTGGGSVNGSVSASAGSTINPGDTIGILIISGNLALAGNLLMELNRTNTPATNDSIMVTGTLTAGGMLTVTNEGPALHAGDSFQLFSAGVNGFAQVNLQTNDTANNVKYTWSDTTASNGKVTVLTVASLVNTNPTNITATVSGGNLTLSWPLDHTGWTLQSQTNSPATGMGTNWVDMTGSAATNQVVLPINATNGSVFFRLRF